MDWRWGVTGFDREIGVCLRVAESNEFLKTFKLQVQTKLHMQFSHLFRWETCSSLTLE